MTASVIRHLHGFSGNRILLLEQGQQRWVRKQGDIKRNLSRMHALQNLLPMPKILDHGEDWVDMEFVHGLDMATYLTIYGPRSLADFLIWTVSTLSQHSQPKRYTQEYQKFLDLHPWDPQFVFSKDDLFQKLPAQLPYSGSYFGDLTPENMIYGMDQRFYLIDCQDTLWDSWIFDVAKLRQDLECEWFLRNLS